MPGMFFGVRIKKGGHFNERDSTIPDEACFIGCSGDQGLNQHAFKALLQEYGLYAVCKGLNSPKEEKPLKALLPGHHSLVCRQQPSLRA